MASKPPENMPSDGEETPDDAAVDSSSPVTESEAEETRLPTEVDPLGDLLPDGDAVDSSSPVTESEDEEMLLPTDVDPFGDLLPSASPPIVVSELVNQAGIQRSRGQRVAIAIGGGRGGVGRSLMTANLGLFLARSGRSVTVVDLDPAGPALHGHLGLSLAVPTPIEQCSGIGVRWERLQGTQLQLCGPTAHFIGYDSQALRRQIIAEVSNGTSEILVFDLGRAYDGISLDVFLDADVAITMSVPEPTAMEQAYGFLRAALFRQLVHAGTTAAAELRGVLATPKGEAMPTFRALMELARREKPDAWRDIRETIGDFVPGIILNRCETRADREMLRGMTEGMNRRWGIDAVPLGTLDEDDVASQSSKWRRPLVSTYPGAAITSGIEQIGTSLLSTFRLDRVAR